VAHFHLGRIEPDVGPVAFERAIEEGFHPLVDRFAQPRHLLFETPVPSIALTRGSTERVETSRTWASWITAVRAFSAIRRGSRKLGKYESLAQLGDAQFDRASPRLPIPVAVARAGRAGRANARHAPPPSSPRLPSPSAARRRRRSCEECRRPGGLLHQRVKVHPLIGHRRFLGFAFAIRNPNPTEKTTGDRRKPLARYGAIESALRERLCSNRATPPHGTRP